MRRALAVVGCMLALASAGSELRIEASEPRAFGYQVGDLVPRRLELHLPAGWQLDEASVPKAGARGGRFELRRLTRTAAAEDGGTRQEWQLEYQVFLAPPAVRTIEIPALRLRVDGPGRSEELLVEAWPVTVAPLVPTEVSPRRGLGELRPDHPPPTLDTGPTRRRLLLWAGLAAALLAWLAVLHLGPPWRLARRRPFGLAWRRLRQLPPQPADDQWRAACRQLHEALNRCAGEVVFEGGLDRFVAAQPAFRSLRGDLARFLQLSRHAFFGGAASAPADGAWLVDLCRRCHDAERGLA